MFDLCSSSRSVAARLDAKDVSSVKRILAGLRLVETGLRLLAGHLSHSTNSVDKEMVKMSVSALCCHSCAAVQEQAQSAATKSTKAGAAANGAAGGAALGERAHGTARLVEAGLPGILTAVLALRLCLSRQATSSFCLSFSVAIDLYIIYLSRFVHLFFGFLFMSLGSSDLRFLIRTRSVFISYSPASVREAVAAV